MKKDKKRKFTQKFGITVDTNTLFNDTKITSTSDKEAIKNIELSQFLSHYENWVNQYIDVVEKKKSDKNKITYKHRIMSLVNQAKGWQEKIAIYLSDDTFKQRYIQLSKRLSNSINSGLPKHI